MKPELQQALAELAKVLTQAAQQVGTVANEQLPLVVQEIIRWGFIKNGLILVAFAAGITVVYKFTQHQAKKHNDDDWRHLGYGISFIMAMVSTIAWVELLKVWFAPRLYLLDYIKDMVK